MMMIMIGEVSFLVWLWHGIRLLYHDDIDAHKVEDRRHYFFEVGWGSLIFLLNTNLTMIAKFRSSNKHPSHHKRCFVFFSCVFVRVSLFYSFLMEKSSKSHSVANE